MYGKNNTTGIVCIEPVNDKLYVYREINGELTIDIQDSPGQILLTTKNLSPKFRLLEGNNHYKYAINYTCPERLKAVKVNCYKKHTDFHTYHDPKENIMIQNGMTYYKGINPKDVSVLSFDIETTGIKMNDTSKVLCISNTFRSNGKIEQRLFSVDEYETESCMIVDWMGYVRRVDPSLIIGHNILCYDLPYIQHCLGEPLQLGRNDTLMTFNKRKSLKRKDGSQAYEFNDVHCFGREIVDTFFLAITYDVQRKYPSYGLKPIIDFEGLEVKGRVHYDASQIGNNWNNDIEREKIKEYAKHDADDALALFDLMIPSFFYYTQSIPKSFQQIINSASGSQLNAFMNRAYIQNGSSVPKKDTVEHFKGGISFGNVGFYKKVRKVDVASLYPSIMRQLKIQHETKDPNAYFYEMVDFFTIERLKNKQLAIETKDRKYKDLEQAQKIMINSAYGFLGANGLNFNYPEGAEDVTRMGREILTKGLDWCSDKGYTVVNADTDSFSYVEPKGYTDELYLKDLEDLNTLFHDLIVWEDDGKYKKVLITKAKNYVLFDGKKTTIKGSALKATMKEPALQYFIRDIIEAFMSEKVYLINYLYFDYLNQVNDIESIKDMRQWSSKKTVTSSVLTGEGTTETKLRKAIQNRDLQEGDKFFVYFRPDTSISMLQDFDGNYCKKTLYSKVFKTLYIFSELLNIKCYADFSKVTQLKVLKETNHEIFKEVIDGINKAV